MESNEQPIKEEKSSASSSRASSRSPSHSIKEKQPQEPTEKEVKILEACKWKDLEAIRELATSKDGLISDEVRRQACKTFKLPEQTLQLDIDNEQ